MQIESALIPRIATGFCSGMARTDGMCGAVSGGIMAIGLALGRDAPGQPVDACYAAVSEFLQRFLSKFTSTSCLELTGVHLGTDEGQAAFLAKGQHAICAGYVAEAARMVIDITQGLDKN